MEKGRGLPALLVVPVLAFGLSAVALGNHPGPEIKGATAHGHRATAATKASVRRPQSIHVRVLADPAQTVAGATRLVCRSDGITRTREARLHGTSPLKKKLRLPTRKPRRCIVSGAAELADSGRITLRLYARPR